MGSYDKWKWLNGWIPPHPALFLTAGWWIAWEVNGLKPLRKLPHNE